MTTAEKRKLQSKRISEALTGRRLTKSHKINIGKGAKKVWKEHKKKGIKRKIHKKIRKQWIKNLSIAAKKQKHTKKQHENVWKARRKNGTDKQTEDGKRKLREIQLKRAYKNGQYCNIGKHEKQLLNEQEKIDNCKIIRQKRIVGYLVDGYCKETNTVYEVYEKGHFSSKEKIKNDSQRQKRIQNALKCKFIIIKDYKNVNE